MPTENDHCSRCGLRDHLTMTTLYCDGVPFLVERELRRCWLYRACRWLDEQERSAMAAVR